MSEGNGKAGAAVGVVEGKSEQLTRQANECETQMARAVKAMHSAAVYFARHVHDYIDNRLWEVAGHGSLQEGLAQPGIGVSESHAKNLALVYKTLVVERKVPVEELLGVDLRTVQAGLPAITAGDAHWQDVVGDARVLSRSDVQEKYGGKRKPNARLDATQEPERQSCPLCGTFVPKDRIPEDERQAA